MCLSVNVVSSPLTTKVLPALASSGSSTVTVTLPSWSISFAVIVSSPLPIVTLEGALGAWTGGVVLLPPPLPLGGFGWLGCSDPAAGVWTVSVSVGVLAVSVSPGVGCFVSVMFAWPLASATPVPMVLPSLSVTVIVSPAVA